MAKRGHIQANPFRGCDSAREALEQSSYLLSQVETMVKLLREHKPDAATMLDVLMKLDDPCKSLRAALYPDQD